jgi:2,4-dienoyl-CoA reductase-like NADH-dependent reductase (Old Yellow Enzyme family)/threonine dehydrogenase-like Zn-dependent dehydrogenase
VTAKDGALKELFSPLDIGPTRVRNRVLMTALSVGYSENNLLSDRHVAYYRERARGGAGLIVTEQQAGHRLSKGSFYLGCSAWEKAAVPQYAKLADAVHEFGGRQFIQLFGCGVHDKGTTIFDEWHPLWGVSAIPSVAHREMPLVVDQECIDDLVRGFGESALNVMTAGIDGIEIQGAHTYLIGQFFSPAYNLREDRYGGSVRNRTQFAIEVAEEVRRRVDTSLTVGLRMSYDEWLGDKGVTPEESDERIDLLAETGLFDYFSISSGGYHGLYKVTPPLDTQPEGFLVQYAERAKAIVGQRARIFTVGRIVDPRMADEIVAEGKADMVGMARAQLADPYLADKARTNRLDEITPCVGANVCLSRLWDQLPGTCVMNPTMGRERIWGKGSIQPAVEPKSVAIVGGGPAGMKVAALAGQRGHKVTLFEQDAALGGHLNLVRKIPARETWDKGVAYLVRSVEQNGIDVRLEARATAEELTSGDFDDVILATGSYWDRRGVSAFRPGSSGIDGADDDTVTDVWSALEQALEVPRSLGERVSIIDESGAYWPLALALSVASAGGSVEIITPHGTIGEDAVKTGELQTVMPDVIEAGVQLTTHEFVEAIDDGQLVLRSVWGGETHGTPAGTVVMSIMRLANDDLYRELNDGSSPANVQRVGDALAPRKLEAVMYEAEKLGREI